MTKGLNDIGLKYEGLNESGWKKVESKFSQSNIHM